MSDPKLMQDVIVVGGGAAGLGAALTLARARRSVIVIDAGEPRNAPAQGVHGFLGLEGVAPQEMLARGRAEVASYGGEVRAGRVIGVQPEGTGFKVELAAGGSISARRLIIATGLVDDLPEIPGLREQWGRGVIHCPYCHGYEVSDQRIAVLATGPMAVHQALLFSQWSRDVTLLVQEMELSEEDRLKLRARGIPVIPGQVAEILAESGQLIGVKFVDGQVHLAQAVVVGARMNARVAALAGIGITATEHPMGSFIATDEFGRSEVPGVWAAGNATDLAAQVITAAAEGSKVAAQVNFDLVNEDTAAAVAQLAD
ncbi:NAD(P)/FAD-dependent oxidoreductase [Corynebacterium sp. A21]|uniref:NAD(P)/FAD-dependent oxidoreductase n=1 Tax=Corynebacterium sp. A21 TaxID=3457318 RepID=UPI003FD5F4FE